MQALVGGERAAKARPGDYPAQAADAAEPRNASRGSAARARLHGPMRHAAAASATQSRHREMRATAAASQAQKRDQLRDAPAGSANVVKQPRVHHSQLRDAHESPAGAANAVKQPRAHHAAAPRACAFNPLCDSRSCRASSTTPARSQRSLATPHSDINFEAFAHRSTPISSCSASLVLLGFGRRRTASQGVSLADGGLLLPEFDGGQPRVALRGLRAAQPRRLARRRNGCRNV